LRDGESARLPTVISSGYIKVGIHMQAKKLMNLQDIARSNYHWNDGKRRVNLILSATLLIALIGAIAYL
jgi:hypothetical protein